MNPVHTFAESAPIFTLLNGLAERLTIPRIDELWLFPPRRTSDVETAVVVIAEFLDDDEDRRRIYTAHYAAVTDRKGNTEVAEHLEERAIAPTHRIGRLVEGVLQRLDDDLATATPRVARIRGSAERWNELIQNLTDDPKWGGAARKFINLAGDRRRDAEDGPDTATASTRPPHTATPDHPHGTRHPTPEQGS